MIPARQLALAIVPLFLTGSLAHARPCVDYGSNPQWLGSAFLDGTVQAVTADAGYAYVGAGSCCPYLYKLAIFDLADPETPVWRGGLDLAGDPTDLLLRGHHLFASLEGIGIAVIDVSDPAWPAVVESLGHPTVNLNTHLTISPDGDLLYVTVTGGLDILDISDPTEPVLVGDVPGPTFAEFAIAREGLAVSTGGGFLRTYDLTDPIAPVLLDDYEADPNCWPADCGGYRSLAANAGFAWVIYRRTWCTDEGCFCSRSSARFATFDLTDPADLSPTYGPFFESGHMTSLELFEGRLHVFGGSDWIFDMSEPTQPELIHLIATAEPGGFVRAGSAELLVSVGSGLRVFDVTNAGRGFVREGERTAPVVDVAVLDDVAYSFSSEFRSPCGLGCTLVCTHIGAVELETGLPLPEVDWNSCDCSYGYFGASVKDSEIAAGDYFVSAETLFHSKLGEPGSPPSSPVTISMPHSTENLAASDPYLLVTGAAAGFSVLDASAEPPALVAEVGTHSSYRLAVSGGLAASLGRDPARTQVEFRTIGLGSLPSAPVHLGELIWPAESSWYLPFWVALDGDVAVVGSYGGTLRTIDVSDPAAPRLAAEIPIRGFGEPGWPAQSSLSGDIFGGVLYVSAGQFGLAAYDVHNPDAPVFLGFASVGMARRVLATPRAVVVATAGGVISVPLDCMSFTYATVAPESHGVPSLQLEADRNPFTSTTGLQFAVPGTTSPALAIYDVGGRRVRSFRPTVGFDGTGSVRWDGRDEAGRAVAPGIYFVRLQAGDATETRKVVRVR